MNCLQEWKLPAPDFDLQFVDRLVGYFLDYCYFHFDYLNNCFRFLHSLERCLLRQSIDSVSYTHLDVYKRQAR